MFADDRIVKAILKEDEIDLLNAINLHVDCDVNAIDDHGRNYLHLAAHIGSYDMVKFFIGTMLDVSKPDNDKVTPLHRAVRSGSENCVELLLQEARCRPDPEAIDQIQPLHIAAAIGHSGIIERLVKERYQNDEREPSKIIEIEGAYVDCRDAKGHTPLHYAANEGHLQAAASLIRRDCDVDAENLARNRPLHFAATSGTSKMCLLLVRASADINAQNLEGQTALHLAVRQGCIETVFELLKANADPNIRDSKGDTCAHLAIKHGGTDLLKTIIFFPQTDLSISDDEENTVLHVALKLGHFNLIPLMLPRARDLTRQDANGCSVLIEAIKNQLEDLALEMLNTCPSLAHTATNELVTPLHLAAERGMTNLTKQLLIAGAQVDATDANGLTPSLYCAKNDSVLECLAMIEDLMMVADNNINDRDELNKGNNSKMSSKISS